MNVRTFELDMGRHRRRNRSQIKILRMNDEDKIKSKAGHYWQNHKIETIVFVVLVVALIVK